jgi:hypothetical protein
MHKRTIAIFTTTYPEGKPFLPDFFRSVSDQTDGDFDLWIGLDRLREAELGEFVSNDYPVTCIERKSGESNISLRQRAVERMIEKYEGIVFVDSDDILLPSRVSAARSALKHYDVYGCAMHIIDEKGNDKQNSFHMPHDADFSTLLPRFNIFGMSNTGYSSEILKKTLPFPDDCILLDWFVATRAWAHDARLVFDQAERMQYRQYSLNTARVLPPFTREQIIKSTGLVLQHYNLVLHNITELPDAKRILLEQAQSYVISFNDSITQFPERLTDYVVKLNRLPAHHIWWSCVAHPKLEAIWKN